MKVECGDFKVVAQYFQCKNFFVKKIWVPLFPHDSTYMFNIF